MLKFKAQDRWLFFILIPFFIILVIHITIPLVFIFQSQSLAVASYTNQNIQNLVTSLRSFVIVQTKQISVLLGTYISFLNVISSTLEKNNTFMKIEQSSLEINNGFEFYQNTNSSLAQEFISIWFASGAISYDDLNLSQKKYFQNFLLKVEPMLRYNYQRETFRKIVTGIYVSYNEPGNQICFHFPSYKQKAFSSLNGSILTQPYQFYITNVNQMGEVVIIEHFGVTISSEDIMSLCIPIINQNLVIGTICIDVNMEFFMGDLTQAIFILERQTIRSKALLLKPTSSGTLPSIIAEATIQNSTISLSYPNNQVYSPLQSNQKDVWGNLFCNSSQNIVQSFMTFKENATQIYIIPICISQGQYGESLLMLYSLEIQASDLITNLNNSEEQYKNFQRVLLITSITAIIFSLLLSVCIMKNLLDSLDIQLYKLEKACKFIAQGDINVRIPDYKETKDIALVYDEIKTINKLFIYSSNEYFSGHYSNKVLKYTQALQFFNKIGYNPSGLYENLGSVYMLQQEFVKAIQYFKLSVDILLQEIEQKFGHFEEILCKKYQKVKLCSRYKNLEITLIRRLWKLNFAYIRFLDLGILKSHNFEKLLLMKPQERSKRDEYMKEMMKYTSLFKKAVYPNYSTYAEVILLYLNQAKLHISEKNKGNAKECWQKAEKYCLKYTQQFDSVTEKLKKKGSKKKLFYRKNKLSRHSRTHPHILKSFCQYIEGLLKLSCKKEKQYYPAICILTEALKKSVLSQTINYIIIIQIREILIELGIDPINFESTQIFREILPQKTLNYEKVTPEVQKNFYKLTRNFEEPGLKEYVLMYDVGQILGSQKYQNNFVNFFLEQTQIIFSKFAQNKDRISIIKFSNDIEMETICKLTLKQYNEHLLRKHFQDILSSADQYSGKSQIIPSLRKVLWRVKKLQSQKIS